jgi:hypothetical protein
MTEKKKQGRPKDKENVVVDGKLNDGQKEQCFEYKKKGWSLAKLATRWGVTMDVIHSAIEEIAERNSKGSEIDFTEETVLDVIFEMQKKIIQKTNELIKTTTKITDLTKAYQDLEIIKGLIAQQTENEESEISKLIDNDEE